MAYKLKPGSRVIKSVRKAARDQIDKALAEIDDNTLDYHHRIHQVRKRCKKLRGLLRLARPAMEDQYQIENKWYRDTARAMSDLRDATAMKENFEALLKGSDPALTATDSRMLNEQLKSQFKEMDEGHPLEEVLSEARNRFEQGRARIPDWDLDEKGYPAIKAGLLKTYKRARSAMLSAYQSPSPDRFHEWRKRVKYHGYHMKLLRELWPELLKPHCQELSKLGDLLGDDHDLAEIDGFVTGAWEPDNERQYRIQGVIKQHRNRMQSEARLLGQRLFAERPKALGKRMGKYWRVAA